MLHHTHKREDCGLAFHDVETESRLPEGMTFFCTCGGEDHGGYFQVEAASADEALQLLPESMRPATKVIPGETLVIIGDEKTEQLPGVRLEQAGSLRLSQYIGALRSELVASRAAQEEIEDLMARIHSVLRRSQGSPTASDEPTVQSGPLRVNLAERRVTFSEREVSLTPMEYSLLRQLLLNKGKVLSHEMLLRSVWGPEYSHEREYLRVFIKRLRSKIEPDPAHPKFITTVIGVGYRAEAHT